MASKRRVRQRKATKGAVTADAPSVVAIKDEETAGAVAVADLLADLPVSDMSAVAEPQPAALTPVRLLHQVGLMWPDDGVRHFYGPGEVQLPASEVDRLNRLRHRVVAR